MMLIVLIEGKNLPTREYEAEENLIRNSLSLGYAV